jgi:hypothetical protein
MLFAERRLQLRVMKELVALAENKQFVTLLSLPDIVPNGAKGILITDPKLDAQLKEWMHTALSRVENQLSHPGAEKATVEASSTNAAERHASSSGSVEGTGSITEEQKDHQEENREIAASPPKDLDRQGHEVEAADRSGTVDSYEESTPSPLRSGGTPTGEPGHQPAPGKESNTYNNDDFEDDD